MCCLTTARELNVIASGLYFANGLTLLPDGRLLVAETYRQRLWIGDWDATGKVWRELRPWVETGGPIGPDGMAVGAGGLLYVAVFGQGRSLLIEPDGRITGALKTPGLRPTNCCFDPGESNALIITEAEQGNVLRCMSACCIPSERRSKRQRKMKEWGLARKEERQHSQSAKGDAKPGQIQCSD